MVPVMSVWIWQKKAYVPAALNVRPPDSPCPRRSVVQAGSSLYVAVCGTPSPLVQVRTSPTLAGIVPGENALPVILASTAPASVDGAHTPPPDPVSVAAADGGAVSAGSGGPTLAVPVDPAGEHATRHRTAVMAKTGSRRVMASSSVRADPRLALSCVYVATAAPVSEGAPA